MDRIRPHGGIDIAKALGGIPCPDGVGPSPTMRPVAAPSLSDCGRWSPPSLPL